MQDITGMKDYEPTPYVLLALLGPLKVTFLQLSMHFMIRFYGLVSREELECRKFHRQGGHSDWHAFLLTSPAAYTNISSGIFISSRTP